MPGSVFMHHLLPPSKIRCRIFVRLAAVPNYLLQENQHCKQFPDGTCSSVEASTLDVNELRLKAKREVQEITSQKREVRYDNSARICEGRAYR